MVAGHDHDVEIARDADDPVEQRQRIVQVGDQEQAHRVSTVNSLLTLFAGSPCKSENRRRREPFFWGAPVRPATSLARPQRHQ